MWLLDANMPVQLVALLKELGIEADSSGARGWNTLSNGSLVTEAVRAKFQRPSDARSIVRRNCVAVTQGP